MNPSIPLTRRITAEFLGTMVLVAVVVGSGVMAERLALGAQAVALLANTVATVAGLVALIASFGPVSGAHFNPLVTVIEAWRARQPAIDAAAYVLAQLAGGICGTLLAHAMFEVPLLQSATHARSGTSLVVSEVVATAGLILVIQGVGGTRPRFIAVAVPAWIGSAYWFTASTSFANPAVTIARAFTDTFSGIRLHDVPGFILGQSLGAVLAVLLSRALFVSQPSSGNQ